MINGIDVKHLRMFETIARCRSFTRAALELHVAQPWLSVQVKRLEDVLGFPLFERNRKQAVTLTAQGQALRAGAAAFLAAHERLLGEVSLIRRQHASALILGAPEFSSDIPERLALLDRFHRALPALEVDILNGHSPALLDQLRMGTLDLSLALGPFRHGPEFDHLVISTTRISLLIPEGHALCGRKELTPKDLRGMTIANFRRPLNPPVYDQLAVRFAEFGAELISFPEATMRAAMQYATSNSVPVIALGWMKPVVAEMSRLSLVPLRAPAAELQLLLMRRSDDTRAEIEALWKQADIMAAEAVGSGM